MSISAGIWVHLCTCTFTVMLHFQEPGQAFLAFHQRFRVKEASQAHLKWTHLKSWPIFSSFDWPAPHLHLDNTNRLLPWAVVSHCYLFPLPLPCHTPCIHETMPPTVCRLFQHVVTVQTTAWLGWPHLFVTACFRNTCSLVHYKGTVVISGLSAYLIKCLQAGYIFIPQHKIVIQ